jgi:predicted TIM-barrel fold metal-dependent hydrolase
MVTETGQRLTLDDVLVVDADVHAHEQPEQMVAYTDPPWREAVANAARVPHRYLSIPGWSTSPPYFLPGAGLPSARGKAREEIVWDAAQMRRELDGLRIDVGVIFPDHFLKVAALPNPDYAAALARAYHRWIEERWVAEENDLYGVVMAVPQDPSDAAREIARYARHRRFVGVYLPTCQTYPLWGHRQYWPIYEAAQEADLPVMLHSVAGSSWVFPFNTEQMSSISVHTASHVFAMMANLMSFMENAVPLRFPKLRICFCEAGLTWVPFLRMRLDKEYNESRRTWPYYQDRPSEYIKKMWFATQPVEEPANPRDLVDLIRIYDGEDTTVFASDWPHHDFDHPRVVFDLPVDNEVKRKLMGLNALRLMPKVRVPEKYRIGAGARLTAADRPRP